jgi:transposase
MYTTYKFKLSRSKLRHLRVAASKVNFVWNYDNETSCKAIKSHYKFLTGFDLNNLTAGSCKLLKIPATTIQAIDETYAKSRKQTCRRKLKWRTRKSLGWIPFKAISIKVKDNKVKFNGTWFKFFKSRELEGKVCTGSFVEDACGDWYLTLVCEVELLPKALISVHVGIDLGLNSIAVSSNGEVFDNPKCFRKSVVKLGNLQRFRKSKQHKHLARKVQRQRQDNLHKISTKLASTYQEIYVGDLKLQSGKSTNDTAYRGLIRLLEYKVSRRQGAFHLVSEAYTTQTCGQCLERSGPKDLTDLSVRVWTCESCGQTHSRDINAAQNILRLGHQTPLKLGKPLANLA